MNKIINVGILIAFSLCYLEWGTGNSAFIFEMEAIVFSKQTNVLDTLFHPAVLLGIAGHVLILISVFGRKHHKTVNLIGILLLSIIVSLILLAGILSRNIKIITSTLPFIALCVVSIVYNRKRTLPAS